VARTPPAEIRSAVEVIAHLALEPHPEGGWFRETFRDETGPQGRAHSTVILFLLADGEVSHWHRVDSVEVWHWYGGAPLALKVADENGAVQEFTLGSDLLGLGRLPGAPWRPAFISTASNSPPRDGCHNAL